MTSSGESPSVLLQRAADELERRAASFANYVDAQRDEDNPHASALAHWLYDNVEQLASPGARRWIEMLAPPAAAPLVAWLTYAQHLYFTLEGQMRSGADMSHLVDPPALAALDFARLILGETGKD